MCHVKVVEMEKYSWSMQQPRQHGNLKLPVGGLCNLVSSLVLVIVDDVRHILCVKVREELPPSEEDWESEATVTRSYDPRAKAEKMQVGGR